MNNYRKTKILNHIAEHVIYMVQSGRKTTKISRLKELLEGYDYERIGELRNG